MAQGRFVRVVSQPQLLALAFGAMVGWSWVALSGNWIAGAGSVGAMLAFLVGGIALIFVGLTYAELASAMPQAGGEHVYSHRALGSTASFICTWAILLAYVSVVAFEAVALPTVVDYLVPGFSRGYLWTIAGWDVSATWVAVGVIAAVLMTLVNIIGIGTAAKLQSLVVLIVLVSGLALMGGSAAGGVSSNMLPYMHNGVGGVLGTLIMVPFMLVGFDVIPQSAEEVNIPFESIGKTIVLSVVIAVAWYIMIIAAVSMGLTAEQRAASSLPTADAASVLLGGPWAGKLLVVGGIAGILTSWNAFLIGGSRALYALANAGQLPVVFARLHPRFNTPHMAILLIGSMSVLAPLFGRPALVWLVDAGGFGVVIAYAMVAWSFLVLRRNDPEMPRPYRVRHGRLVGILALVFSLGLCTLYLPWSPSALVWPEEWAIVFSWTAIGVLLLALSGRRPG
jgi:APA family basic amino acid/polyamine antiporter